MTINLTGIHPGTESQTKKVDPGSVSETSLTTNIESSIPLNIQEELQPLHTDPKLTSQQSYPSMIAAQTCTEEYQLRLLTELEKRINEKKKEFVELVNSPEGFPEEKLDLDRALKRMDRLFELARDSKLLKNYPVVFQEYINDLTTNVLEKDARNLNFILACTPVIFDSTEHFEAMVQKWEPVPANTAEYENKLREILPKWDTTSRFFYMPGLPIVVKVDGIPEHFKSFVAPYNITLKENGLTTEDIKKISEAATLIIKSKWQELEPKSLTITESISFVEKADFGGIACSKGHPIIVLSKEHTPRQIAGITIHEDWHYVSRYTMVNNSVLEHDYENKDRFPQIKHTWLNTLHDSRRSLLSELYSYGIESKFYLVSLFENLLDEKEKIEAVKSLNEKLSKAKKGIQILRGNPEHLNEAGIFWLNDMEKFWSALEKGIEYQSSKLIPEFLKSENKELRKLAGDALCFGYGKSINGDDKLVAIREHLLQCTLLEMGTFAFDGYIDKSVNGIAKQSFEEVFEKQISSGVDKERREIYSSLNILYNDNKQETSLLEKFSRAIVQENDIFEVRYITSQNSYSKEFRDVARERFFAIIQKQLNSTDCDERRRACWELSKVFNDDNEGKEIYLKIYLEHLEKEKDPTVLKSIIRDNDYPVEFYALARERFSKITASLLCSNEDNVRSSAYFDLASLYINEEEQNRAPYLELFSTFMRKEKSKFIVSFISNYEFYPEEFQKVAKERLAQVN